MQELQVNSTNAKIEIVDKEAFENNVNEVFTKYRNYTVTASTIKDDKTVLASLRKLVKQISDKRIEIKKELTAPVTEFEQYVKKAIDPLNNVINSINNDIKTYEEHQKILKLDTVKSYIANKASEYMLDPRVFNEKASEHIKAADFMADGVTLKKATMKSLDDLVAFEYQKQQEYEKAKATISGQCAEYGMTDQPYIRMLKDLTVLEVLGQIKSDYLFEQEKRKVEKARLEREALLEEQRAKEEAQNTKNTPDFNPETGEIIEGGQLSKNNQEPLREPKNEPEKYTQTMELKVFFKNSTEKDKFKQALSEGGFEYRHNYWTHGYSNITSVTQEELENQFRLRKFK